MDSDCWSDPQAQDRCRHEECDNAQADEHVLTDHLARVTAQVHRKWQVAEVVGKAIDACEGVAV